MDVMQERIQRFLASDRFAVVGASNDLAKYGAKVFACYLQNGRTAYPVHPKEKTIQGRPAYPTLKDLPAPVAAISVITPPAVTEKVVEEAIAAGARHIWMQPGAESAAAVARATQAGLSVISGGPCLLVALHYKE